MTDQQHPIIDGQPTPEAGVEQFDTKPELILTPETANRVNGHHKYQIVTASELVRPDGQPYSGLSEYFQSVDFIVIGIGNSPDPASVETTSHNIGAYAVAKLVQANAAQDPLAPAVGVTPIHLVEGEEMIEAYTFPIQTTAKGITYLPLTLNTRMEGKGYNSAGELVSQLVTRGVAPERIVLVLDNLSLPFGESSYTTVSGETGNPGSNALRSIISGLYGPEGILVSDHKLKIVQMGTKPGDDVDHASYVNAPVEFTDEAIDGLVAQITTKMDATAATLRDAKVMTARDQKSEVVTLTDTMAVDNSEVRGMMNEAIVIPEETIAQIDTTLATLAFVFEKLQAASSDPEVMALMLEGVPEELQPMIVKSIQSGNFNPNQLSIDFHVAQYANGTTKAAIIEINRAPGSLIAENRVQDSANAQLGYLAGHGYQLPNPDGVSRLSNAINKFHQRNLTRHGLEATTPIFAISKVGTKNDNSDGSYDLIAEQLQSNSDTELIQVDFTQIEVVQTANGAVYRDRVSGITTPSLTIMMTPFGTGIGQQFREGNPDLYAALTAGEADVYPPLSNFAAANKALLAKFADPEHHLWKLAGVAPEELAGFAQSLPEPTYMATAENMEATKADIQARVKAGEIMVAKDAIGSGGRGVIVITPQNFKNEIKKLKPGFLVMGYCPPTQITVDGERKHARVRATYFDDQQSAALGSAAWPAFVDKLTVSTGAGSGSFPALVIRNSNVAN